MPAKCSLLQAKTHDAIWPAIWNRCDPLRALLNTLYVTTQGAYLNKDGETVLVSVEKKTRMRVPIHTLSGIVCFGNVGCSPFLMGFCAERQVGLSFLSEHGRFLARVEGETERQCVAQAQEQYRLADSDAASTEIARGFPYRQTG